MSAAYRHVEVTAPVKFFVQDEARFGCITGLGKSWAPYPIRPKARAYLNRTYTYAYMAVCPESGESLALILPDATTECMQIFLDHLSHKFANNLLVMQVDGAGWHRSQQLHIPPNIVLLFQPPYSPELNPIEGVWRYIKTSDFRNRLFKTVEDVREQLSRSLSLLMADTRLLQSMTQFPHIVEYLNAN